MKKALVIVAHPDDETIWMGGLILAKKDWDWTIISLCRASDKDRAPKFKRIAKHLNAKGTILDLDDEKDDPLPQAELKKAILSNTRRKSFDIVFTHGANGEYGHVKHLDAHKAVSSLVMDGKLKTKELWFFSYVPGKVKSLHNPELFVPIPSRKADWVFSLTDKQYKEKLRIITEMYGYIHPIMETMSCSRKESFDRWKKDRTFL